LGAEVERDQRRLQLAHQARNFRDSHEDLDFDEVFEDDEEGGGAIGDDFGANEAEASGGKSPLKKETYKLTTEGRQMKKIVRQLDKDNDIIYASDDEMDPYASDEAASEEEEDLRLPLQDYRNAKTDEGNFDKLVDSVMTAKSRSATPANSRATSTSGSPQKVASVGASTSTSASSKKVKQDTSTTTTATATTITATDDIITESMLVSFLRQGPLSTKDLISKFKRQLKADPKNKDIFRELVRKVAMVKAGGVGSSGEEDKLLELKPEYR
jgi:transcription initiation factor TFIIF subunit alpha